MKAPAQLDDGGALSLKTKFVNFIEFGSHNKEIEDYKEVGERLLTWEKIRCEPVEAYENHMGTQYKPLQAIESRERDATSANQGQLRGPEMTPKICTRRSVRHGQEKDPAIEQRKDQENGHETSHANEQGTSHANEQRIGHANVPRRDIAHRR